MLRRHWCCTALLCVWGVVRGCAGATGRMRQGCKHRHLPACIWSREEGTLTRLCCLSAFTGMKPCRPGAVPPAALLAALLASAVHEAHMQVKCTGKK